MRNRLGTFLFLTILAATLLGGFFGAKVSAEATLTDSNKDLLKTFTEVYAKIEKEYAGDTTSEDLVESAIRGMLRTLDPHSSFFSTRDYDRLQEEQKGKYYGLGITIRPEAPGSGRVVIVEPPAPGTPAYKAGLRAGDVIAKIEGEPIDNWDLNSEVIPNLKGPKGTTVNITVERPGDEEAILFDVERDEIPLYTIKFAFRVRPHIGYVRISRFAETTADELDEAFDSIGREDLEGLILDLRDNPGGALTQALEVSDRFLGKGEEIVSTRTRTGRDDKNYVANRGPSVDTQVVVLINENSASASEIVAGALQDHDRALIVGETSFGKALVQTIFPLQGNRGLALTTGRYYTPSDRLIQRDYSESFWDYYNNRSETAKHDRDKFFTDGGRVVYGGGGIAPDYEVELDPLSKVVRRIERKSLFREFASKVYSGEIDVDLLENLPEDPNSVPKDQRNNWADSVQISEETYDRFREFVGEEGVDISADEYAANEDSLKNFLRQQLLLLYVGDEARYQTLLDLDKQVQTAIDLLPRVNALLETKAPDIEKME